MFEETKLWKNDTEKGVKAGGHKKSQHVAFPQKKNAWKCTYLPSQWDWVNSAYRQLKPNSPDLMHMTSTIKRWLNPDHYSLQIVLYRNAKLLQRKWEKHIIPNFDKIFIHVINYVQNLVFYRKWKCWVDLILLQLFNALIALHKFPTFKCQNYSRKPLARPM